MLSVVLEVLYCIGAALLFAYVALYKNRNVIAWALVGPLVPLAFPVLIMLPKLCASCRKPLSGWDAKHARKCPHCGESTDPVEGPEEELGRAEGAAAQSRPEGPPCGDTAETEDAPGAGDETLLYWAVAERGPRRGVESPPAGVAEIESALASDDELDRKWALAELDRLPPEQAERIRQRSGEKQAGGQAEREGPRNNM